jgi:hypothetical protein
MLAGLMRTYTTTMNGGAVTSIILARLGTGKVFTIYILQYAMYVAAIRLYAIGVHTPSPLRPFVIYALS